MQLLFSYDIVKFQLNTRKCYAVRARFLFFTVGFVDDNLGSYIWRDTKHVMDYSLRTLDDAIELLNKRKASNEAKFGPAVRYMVRKIQAFFNGSNVKYQTIDSTDVAVERLKS